jgi:outer membrane lipoprotein
MMLATLGGCSAISPGLRSQAVLDPPLGALVPTDGPPSETLVVLGGYILETRNETAETLITVLQAPLGLADEPGRRDSSQGRFVLRQSGFRDPAVFAKDRKLTAVGKVVGTISTSIGDQSHTLALIDALEIYLWPEPLVSAYPPCTWCDDPFYYHYDYRPLWYRHPYHHHYPYYPYRHYRPYWRR